MTAPAGTDVRITPLGGRFGAEISGVDVAEPLDPAVRDRIARALLDHKVVGLRGQSLDEAGHQRFLATFGPLTGAHPTVPSLPGHPNVLEVAGREGARSNRWHTDVTYLPAPPAITSLRALVVPPRGGDTLVADAAAAYRDLPEPLRVFADHLWAAHSNDYDYLQPQFHNDAATSYRRTFLSRRWESVHPAVRVHPVTGERGLFLGAFVTRFVGRSGTESRDVLRLLQAYVARPENVLRWHWEPGDLLLLDNRITQHYAPDDYGDLPRTLHRVTVAGDLPVGVDGRRSHLRSGDDAADYQPADHRPRDHRPTDHQP